MKHRALRAAFYTLLGAAIGGVAMVAGLFWGGSIEGYLRPVMGELTIYAPRPYGESGTVWRGIAEKKRGCDFVGIEWFLGPRDGRRVQVRSEFLDRPEIRERGVLHWDGIVVDLTAPQVREHSHADVLHDCPLTPWLVRTRFYDSED